MEQTRQGLYAREPHPLLLIGGRTVEKVVEDQAQGLVKEGVTR